MDLLKHINITRFLGSLITFVLQTMAMLTSFKDIYPKELELKVERTSFLDLDIKIEDLMCSGPFINVTDGLCV